MNNIDLYFKI